MRNNNIIVRIECKAGSSVQCHIQYEYIQHWQYVVLRQKTALSCNPANEQHVSVALSAC